MTKYYKYVIRHTRVDAKCTATTENFLAKVQPK